MTDSLSHDLTINTGAMSVEAAAEVVVVLGWIVAFRIDIPCVRAFALLRPGVKNKYPRALRRAGEKNWSAQSSGNHAKDSRHEFTTEKIHPSALPVTKGHAPEAVTLDLHRQAQNRQWPVLILFKFLNFVLHTTTYAGIRESARFISEYTSRRMCGH
ncbi:MAG: hypothetical protein ABSD57_11360 [Verrucomicrobiota bacterium]